MQSSLIVPMAAHVALAAFLYVLLTVARAPAIWGIGRRADGSNPFAAYEPRVSANLSNQFEWPLLFYVACVLLMLEPPVDLLAWALAWLFVIGRALHSAVQILTRNVRLRGIVFMLNFLAVLGLWVLVAMPVIRQPEHQRWLAEQARAEKEVLARAEPQHRLDVFGGTLFGKDLGEWGGEVGFRDASGSERQLIDDNSQGIYKTPFGVVALTGLAHMWDSHGSVYVISQDADGAVRADRSMALPGWPCHTWTEGGEVKLRVFLDYKAAPVSSSSPAKPLYRCYSLQSPHDIVPMACPVTIPEGCYQ